MSDEVSPLDVKSRNEVSSVEIMDLTLHSTSLKYVYALTQDRPMKSCETKSIFLEGPELPY